MRVLIVNTSEKTGGAAIAANRLMKALNKHGVKAKMLVAKKETEDINVVEAGSRWKKKAIFLIERLALFVRYGFRRDGLFDIDDASFGIDITKTREFKEADVIHLNWINQGFLSLKTIRKILASGKPIVWTLHDIWPATAVCHVAGNCTRLKNGECKRCPVMHSRSDKDYANKVWKRKSAVYKKRTLLFVGCSRWMTNKTKQSKLLEGHKVLNIPNTIDTHWYCRGNAEMAAEEYKNVCRKNLGLPLDKKIILFVSQRITQQRKGIQYLIDALNLMAENRPDFAQNHCVAILGGSGDEIVEKMPIPAVPLGYISNHDHKIVEVYNAADVFVTPSLEDNLPNTIMEAMACGLPCVGFNVGGIPEMIDNRKNGYIAEFKNTEELANGINFVLENENYQALSDNALAKVRHSYSEQAVAMNYREAYHQALHINNI